MKKYIVGLLALALMGSTAYGYSGGPQKGIDVGIGARATEKIYLQLGSSSTFKLYVGSDTVSGSGTAGYMGTTTGFPSIEVSRSAGSTSVNFEGFNSVKIDGVDIATGSLGGKLDAVDGAGTRTTLNDPTLAGAGTVTATMSYSGVSISPTEVSYVDGLSQNIQTSLDGKQVAGEYITGITADGKTGTTSAVFIPGSNMSIVAVESNGEITMTFQPTGSVSAKPDIREGGGTTTVGATFLNFNASDFDTTNNSPGTDIALSSQQRGTSTASPDYIVKGNASGQISTTWFPGGMPVKISATATSSLVSLSTIPDDNTLPESTEGTEVLTLSHTSASASHWLLVEAVANISVNSIANIPIAAIFKNSDTNAIGANRCMLGANASNNKDTIVSVSAAPFLAGTTTPFVFKLRCGADGGTIKLNGSSQDGLTRFGGVWYTWLKVTEFKP